MPPGGLTMKLGVDDRDWFYFNIGPTGKGKISVTHVAGDCRMARLNFTQPGPPGPDNGGGTNGPDIPELIGGEVAEPISAYNGEDDGRGGVISVALGDPDLFYGGFVDYDLDENQGYAGDCVVRIAVTSNVLVSRKLPSDARYLADEDVRGNNGGDVPLPRP